MNIFMQLNSRQAARNRTTIASQSTMASVVPIEEPSSSGTGKKTVRLQVTGLLQVPVGSEEWEGKEESKGAVPTDSEGDSLGLDWEGQVRVGASLWRAEDVVHGSGRDLEVSGSLRSSQANSGNHFCVVYGSESGTAVGDVGRLPSQW